MRERKRKKKVEQWKYVAEEYCRIFLHFLQSLTDTGFAVLVWRRKDEARVIQ